MSYRSSSKKDIAKQFELPERKSKIATLLKESDVYCICRSTDSTRFMIACDNCEEWYHGDCINITEPESRNIKQYFCPPCVEQNPSLEIEYKKPKGSPIAAREKASKRPDKKTGRQKKSSTEQSIADQAPTFTAGCGSCSGCLTILDCGRCDNCKRNRKYGSKDRRQCRKRECVDESDNDFSQKSKPDSLPILTDRNEATDDEDDWQPSPVKSRKQKSGPSTAKKGRKQQRKEAAVKAKARRKTKTQRQPSFSGSSGREDSDATEETQQCFGLDCVNAAKKNSKYCSDECGVKLATDRLYRVLPGRIQEWNLTPCTAEEHNKRDLEEIRRKQQEARTSLTDLERKRSELDHHVQFVQQLTVDPDMEEEEQQEEEGIIHCITCGHEISVKTCLKHMERCYNKYESQTSFGSIYKTKLEGTPIFCDVFNPANGTYCKRLQVLCPEHTKEPKIRDLEVCGCPLIKDLFQPSREICRYAKKKCNKHFCWEKLRRAEIDMERVRNWLKLDELMEQERQIRTALTNRAGVMGLLLHSTFDHDLRSRIVNQIQEGTSQKESDDSEESSSESRKESPKKSPKEEPKKIPKKERVPRKDEHKKSPRREESKKSPKREEPQKSYKKEDTKNASVAAQPKKRKSTAGSSNGFEYFESSEDDVVGKPLVKKREHHRSGGQESTEKREELTASKLYKRMMSNRVSQDSQD